MEISIMDIKELSKQKREPNWMFRLRQKAFEIISI